MFTLRFVLLMTLAASYGSAQAANGEPHHPHRNVPASCPVTERPLTPYSPPPPFDEEKLSPSTFWFGTDRLFIALNEQMTWWWEPRAPGHESDEYPRTTKLFFGHAGYNPYLENFPKLTITGRRLDGPAPALFVNEASNALGKGSTGAMVTAFYVPAAGCWEITGEYQDESLSFVVWVTPQKKEAQPTPTGQQPASK
jgi:hypothetical protein